MPKKHPDHDTRQQIIRCLRTGFYEPITITDMPNLPLNEWLRRVVPHPHVFWQSKKDFTQGNKSLKSNLSLRPYVKSRIRGTEVILELSPFVGIFGRKYSGPKYEKQYIGAARKVIHNVIPGHTLVVDLRKNNGGDDKVMRRAISGVQKWPAGKVLVSGKTFSAGEMIAADLIYDHGFKKVGPPTGGGLTKTRNLILSDGSFFMYPISMYTTPGGRTMTSEKL